MDFEVRSIYILPTEEGMPPRAVLRDSDEELEEGGTLSGVLAVWSPDLGAWCLNDLPLPMELNEAITEHAKELGVEWPGS